MNIIVSAGGTGGHIYPALALINKFKEKEKNINILYIGTHNRMEKNLVPSLGIKYQKLEIYGFSKTLIWRDFKNIFLVQKAIIQCKKIMKEFKPDVVIGAGGYVTLPVIYAAKKMGIKTVLLEQNSIPGKTNKILSKNADLVCTSYENSNKYFTKAKKVICTGNPSAYYTKNMPIKKESLGFNKNKKLVLVVAGSLGSETLNNFFTSFLEKVSNDDPFEVLYITGRNYYREFTENKKFPKGVKIEDFIDNLAGLFNDTDLVITRAGASTLSELVAYKVPSIIIPSPYVAGNHQYYNALDLEKKKVGIVCEEKDLEVNKLYNMVKKLLEPSKEYLDMKKRLEVLAKVKSDELVYNKIKELTK